MLKNRIFWHNRKNGGGGDGCSSMVRIDRRGFHFAPPASVMRQGEGRCCFVRGDRSGPSSRRAPGRNIHRGSAGDHREEAPAGAHEFQSHEFFPAQRPALRIRVLADEGVRKVPQFIHRASRAGTDDRVRPGRALARRVSPPAPAAGRSRRPAHARPSRAWC